MHYVALLVLFLVTFGYMFLGAAVFNALEADDRPKFVVDESSITEFLDSTPCPTREQLETFARDVISQYKSGVIPYNDTAETVVVNRWDIAGAFFFCATIVTTIGYGHISLSTTGGKVFCIVYALIGIPLMGAFLVGIGTKINRPIKAFKNRSTNKYIRVLKSILTFIMGFIVLISIPAAVFHFVENWKFLDSVYYAVITLTTVGFGDFVAGINTEEDYRLLYKILLVVWMLVGLSWVAAVIADIADYVTETVEARSKRLDQRKQRTAPPENGLAAKSKIPDVYNVESSYRHL